MPLCWKFTHRSHVPFACALLPAEELGLTKGEVGAMYARDPGTLLTSLAHIQEVAAWLR